MTKHILFVDDEPEFLDAHVAALENAGFSVTQVQTYNQAEAELKGAANYDLIILDILLPNENEVIGDYLAVPKEQPGIKLALFIRKEMKMICPIIFLSVVDDPEISAEIRKLENEYTTKFILITKPALPSKLLSEVRRVLGDVL